MLNIWQTAMARRELVLKLDEGLKALEAFVLPLKWKAKEHTPPPHT